MKSSITKLEQKVDASILNFEQRVTAITQLIENFDDKFKLLFEKLETWTVNSSSTSERESALPGGRSNEELFMSIQSIREVVKTY